MASRKSSKPSQGGHQTLQKQRSEGERERGRASGGGLRNQPVDEPPGNSASTGGRTSKSGMRNDLNSRSSNAGNQGHRKGSR
jgi:hypothetical protein